MEPQTEVTIAPRYDSLLLAAAALLLMSAMGAFYYFAEVNALLRVLGLLAATGAALALAYRTELGRTVWSYLVGARIELRKVVWPSRQESVQATLMIAVVVLITALLLWGLDSLLLFGVKQLTGQA
ncbi:MAG: preprotein translocase subunit SecE [Panacagrimonas sp.]